MRGCGNTAGDKVTAHCQGQEQGINGREQFCSATLSPATLRTLFVTADTTGLSVSASASQFQTAKTILPAPSHQEHDVW